MRSSRQKKQDARRRQEQEYRETIAVDYSERPVEKSAALVPIPIATPIPAREKARSNPTLVILAYSLGVVGLGINAYFAWNRGTTFADRVLMSSLGFISEAIMFYLPAQTSALWKQRRWGGFAFSSVVCVFLFVFAMTNSLGFASFNLAESTMARAERVTPAILDAQRKLDTLSASRKDECVKRGDKCRQLEKDEQAAIESLKDARSNVSLAADPQIAAAAKLIAWISFNRYQPAAENFAMLRLLLLTLLPQLGGLVLLAATKL